MRPPSHSPGTLCLAPGSRARRSSGFTILEVALAATVLALGISSAIVVMQSAFKALDVARDTTLASQILQSEMERLRLMAWSNTSTTAVDSITELSSQPEAVSLATMFSASSDLAAKFQVTRTVTPGESYRAGSVRYITISVTWRSFDGRTHTRSFRSMYAKNGLYDYYYTVATGGTPAAPTP